MKKHILISIGGGLAAALVIIFVIISNTPTQDYALFVDPIITKGGGSTDTHVTIKNIGRQPVTNIVIDYGAQTKPDNISILNPGERIDLSPPQGSNLDVVKVTADNGVNIIQPYRTPVSAPNIGNGGFSQ